MRAASLAFVLSLVTCEFASAAPLELKPGFWEFTTLLRNFSISPDGQHENEGGGSGPYVDHACVTKHALETSSLYPGLKNPMVASRCKATTISETPNLIDSVVECSAAYGGIPQVNHTIVVVPTPKSFATIVETTFLQPNYEGSISRSTSYKGGRWLKSSCSN